MLPGSPNIWNTFTPDYMHQPTGPALDRDQQLLQRLRLDDQRAWRDVYDNNRSIVVNYLRKRGAPAEIALHIYQDALVFLDERKYTLTLTSKLSTYLVGVALNKLREYWKEQKETLGQPTPDFEQRIARHKPAEDEPEEAELALLQLASEENSLFDLDIDDQDVIVQKALAQISLKHCADIFQMRYWNGFDDRQIAAQLGLSHGSVRNQVIDCKKKLRAILLDMGWGK